MKGLFRKKSAGEAQIVLNTANNSNGNGSTLKGASPKAAYAAAAPNKKEGTFGLRGLLSANRKDSFKTKPMASSTTVEESRKDSSLGPTIEETSGQETLAAEPIAGEGSVINSNDADNSEKTGANGDKTKTGDEENSSILKRTVDKKADEDSTSSSDDDDEFDANEISSPAFDASAQKRASLSITPPPTTPSLVSEISNKARLRRAASNIVDQEFSSDNKKNLSNQNSGGRAGSFTRENKLPAGGNSLNIALPQRAIGKDDTSSVRGATTTAASSRVPLSKNEGSASTTTNASRSFQRKATQSIACPGFDSEAAESELRKALQLRKLKTLQQ